ERTARKELETQRRTARPDLCARLGSARHERRTEAHARRWIRVAHFAFTALRTRNQTARSPPRTGCARIREVRHRNILSNARDLSGCIAAGLVAKCQSPRTQRQSRRPDFRTA